jgi:hypothetical protein
VHIRRECLCPAISLGHYSTLRCSLVFVKEASELIPLEVPLGLSAWKEKSISPTRVLTCLSSCQHGISRRNKQNSQNLLDQLLNVCGNAASTDLQHGKSAVLGLNNMPYTENVLVDRLDSSHKSIRLG